MLQLSRLSFYLLIIPAIALFTCNSTLDLSLQRTAFEILHIFFPYAVAFTRILILITQTVIAHVFLNHICHCMYLEISSGDIRPISRSIFPMIFTATLKTPGCLSCNRITAVANLTCASRTRFLFHVGTMLPPFCVCFASILRQVCKHGRSRLITVFAYHIPVAPKTKYSPYHTACMTMINRCPAPFKRFPADSTTVILTLEY